MNELEKLLNKYRRMAGNIRWHLKTNKPTDKMEIQKCNQQIEDYEQVERDLISLVAQFTPQSAQVSETTVQVEALKQIEQMSDCGGPLTAVIRMKQIATKALAAAPLPAHKVDAYVWNDFSENCMPEPKQLVWVERNNGNIYLANRNGIQPFTINEDLSKDCFWYGNLINELSETVNAFSFTIDSKYNFADGTVKRWRPFSWLSLQPVSTETDIKNISQMGEQC